ncbi:MAG TPA: glycosyltransferase [Puia sp.]|nr:glycosyltransferase [Puia sp.]
MKILIDSIPPFKNHLSEEFELYLLKAFIALKKEKPQVEFCFTTDEFPMVKIPACISAENIIERKYFRGSLLWSGSRFIGLLGKIKPDIFININGIFSGDIKIPQCIWITGIRDNPDKHNKYLIRIEKKLSETIQDVSLIFTESEYYRKKLLQQYPSLQDKIIVVPPAANGGFRRVSWEEKENIKKEYTKGKEYFLIQSRNFSEKDLIDLLKAFSIFKKKQHSNMQCIIAGEKPDKKFLKKMELFKYHDDVIVYTGSDETELRKISSASYACLLSGDMNGFLSAFEMCVPVICEMNEHMHEITGEAVLYTKFRDVEQTANQLISIYKNENLRNELIKKGIKRTQQFSQQNQVMQLWKGIEFVIETKTNIDKMKIQS